MIELDQLLRETDLCVQGLRKYFWQLVPWLVQEQKINTIGLDQSTSINFWERHICEFKVCVYFWQLVPWLVQKLDCVYFFALAPARALAVKNIYANLELTNQFLLIIGGWLLLIYGRGKKFGTSKLGGPKQPKRPAPPFSLPSHIIRP